MASVMDSFLDLERHIRQLKANVNKLKKALEHWRKWDAEYEALKEEVLAVSKTREAADLARIRSGFEGELVNKKEMDEMFGQGPTSTTRSAAQVANILDRRIDYVSKNIKTLERQVEEAERKLEAANVVSDPGATDENGLPITEIFERLDEDDNVISHELWTPGSKAPQVEEILQKAGLGGASASKETATAGSSGSSEPSNQQTSTEQHSSTEKPNELDETMDRPSTSTSPHAPTRQSTQHAATDLPVRTKEVVSNVEPIESTKQPEMSRAAQRVQKIMDKAREQEEISKEAPVIPSDESPEDAALRRQMLDYSMSQTNGSMGEVVAIMTDLRYEESDDDDSFNDSYWNEEDEDEDEEEDEEEEVEDKYGRTTRRVVSSKYQSRMLDLEQRLGVQSRFTRQLAEQAEVEEDDDSKEGIGRIVVRRTEVEPSKEPPSVRKPPSSDERPSGGILKSNSRLREQKSVRFAEELDIAPADAPPTKEKPKPEPKAPVENPVSDFIIEQTGPSSSETQRERPRKASRFQQMRAATSKPKKEEVPEKPKEPKEDTIMTPLAWSDTPTRREESRPADMDEFDEAITQREIADEYHRRRRRMIEKQGGFLKEEQNPIERIDDDGEPPRRMSRFRAARLSKD